MNNVLSMIKNGGNPQQIMMNLLVTQLSGTPMGDNLISLAKSDNSQGIEQFARNYLAQQGRDFDQEFNAFRQSFMI